MKIEILNITFPSLLNLFLLLLHEAYSEMADTLINCFHTVKIGLRFFIKPIFIVGFYHFDVSLDVLNTANLFSNCHYNFGAFSVSVMFCTYITTVLFLKFSMKKRWKVAILYPTYYW